MGEVYRARDTRPNRDVAVKIAIDVDRPSNPRLSPDGGKLAAIVAGNLWVYDLAGRPPIRLTFGGSHYSPLWTPDGRRIAHESGSVITAVPADGSAASPELMSPAEGHFHPHGWSRDGREIIFVARSSTDIVSFSLQAKGDPQNIVATAANEGASGAAMSPDGEWLAYVSDETGRPEIWVRPYGHAGQAVRLSANGGVDAGSQFNFKPATLLSKAATSIRGSRPPATWPTTAVSS
jgi:eukaryotic-like serine/threonine-protein kinase